MEKRASGADGGAGEGCSGASFVEEAAEVVESMPKRAPAAAMAPRILRRGGSTLGSGFTRLSEGFSMGIVLLLEVRRRWECSAARRRSLQRLSNIAGRCGGCCARSGFVPALRVDTSHRLFERRHAETEALWFAGGEVGIDGGLPVVGSVFVDGSNGGDMVIAVGGE